MEKTRIRTYQNDGDALDIPEAYDELWKKWLGDFSILDEKPRYTPGGRPWVDVTCGDECPFCDAGNDGGACSYFRREKPKDVIAVCFCDERRVVSQSIGGICSTKT